MGRNRDAALKEAEAQAEADHARDKELRDLVSKNPGRWPRVEAGGIRVQDWKVRAKVTTQVAGRPVTEEVGVDGAALLDALEANVP